MVGRYLGFVVISFCLAPVLGQTPALGSLLGWPLAEAWGLFSGFPHLLLDRFTRLRGQPRMPHGTSSGLHSPVRPAFTCHHLQRRLRDLIKALTHGHEMCEPLCCWESTPVRG